MAKDGNLAQARRLSKIDEINTSDDKDLLHHKACRMDKDGNLAKAKANEGKAIGGKAKAKGGKPKGGKSK